VFVSERPELVKIEMMTLVMFPSGTLNVLYYQKENTYEVLYYEKENTYEVTTLQ